MEKTNSNITIKQVLALRVKEIRKNQNISQLQFLVDTNIHIGRIEMGKTNVTIETFFNICKYLNVSA